MSTRSHRTQELAVACEEQPHATETTHPFEPLLDTEEAARLLRMHSRTLRRKARKGMIPGVQVGGRWRFRASVLNRWLEGAQARASGVSREGGSTSIGNRGMLARSANTV